MPHHVFRDCRFGDVDAQFQQLAMDPRCTPAWVVAAHHPNQFPNLLRDAWPTGLTPMNVPPPEQAECLPVPGYNPCPP